MEKMKKQEHMVHSIEEFRRIYMPKQTTIRIMESPKEAHDFGIDLANESIKKLKIESIK